MAGWVEGICRALVLGLVLIAGTAIEQAPSVGPPQPGVCCFIVIAELQFLSHMNRSYVYKIIGYVKCP